MSKRFRRLDDGLVVHTTPGLAIREYSVERSGVPGKYSVVERPDAVIIVPLTPTDRTVLLKQFRFPTNEDSWELPMGGVDGSEDPSSAAQRELTEETGLRADAFVKIGEYRAAPGLTRQRVTVFRAMVSDNALEASAAASLSADEIQEVRIVSLNELATMVSEGRITDGFSLAGFMLLRCWLDQQDRGRP